MSEPRASKTFWVAVWLFSIVAFWAVTGWLGNRVEPWAIEMTDPAFAAALVWTYVAAGGVAVVSSRRRRVMMLRFAGLTISMLLILCILEAAAVVGLVDYGRLRGAMTEGWSGPQAVFIGDHEFSFRRPSNARWSGRPRSDMAQAFNLPIRSSYEQTFSTDSHGFRNQADFARADIALVGDSYIEGAYISDEETVAVRLHELTGRAVANLGVSGYGTEQELRVLEKYAFPLEPQMVAWFFFEGNDLDDDQAFDNAMVYEGAASAPHPPAPAPVKWRDVVNRSFMKNAFVQTRQFADILIPNRLDSFGWFRDADGTTHRFYFYDVYAKRVFGAYEQQRLEATKATLLQGAERARQHGIALVVYYVPFKFRVYADLCTFPAGSPCPRWRPWDLESQFAAFCREAGIQFVSLTEPMRRAASAGEVLYAPEDSHWNAAGHAFVARQVAATWASAVSNGTVNLSGKQPD